MQGLQSVFGEQATAITLVIIVLGLALALVLLFWVFRKIATSNALRASRNRQPRLSVTDAAVVDDKRRLVLVRRDTVEHLVMIGGPSDIVIEQNISQARPAPRIQPLERTEEAPPAADAAPTGITAGPVAASVAMSAAADAASLPDAPAQPAAAQSAAMAATEPAGPAPAGKAADADSIELDLSELAQELGAPEDAAQLNPGDEELQNALARELEADSAPAAPANPDTSAAGGSSPASLQTDDALAGIEEALAEEMSQPAAQPAKADSAPQEQAPPNKGKDSKTEVERLLDELTRA